MLMAGKIKSTQHLSFRFTAKEDRDSNYMAGFISCENTKNLIEVLRAISASVDPPKYDLWVDQFYGSNSKNTAALLDGSAEVMEERIKSEKDQP